MIFGRHELYLYFETRAYSLHYEKFADGTVKEIEVPYELPAGWEWAKVRNIAQAKGGKRVPKGMKLQEQVTGYPYLRVTDMKKRTILLDKLLYASEEIHEKIKNYTITSDNVYLTIAGTIGLAGTVPRQLNGALLTENALKLILFPEVNQLFLVETINAGVVQKQFATLFKQVAQPKLSIKSTNSTLVPIPPKKEQIKIVSQINRLNDQVDIIEKEQHDIQQLATQLKQKVLDVAMQGKLVPQDPNDEPASVLLEKIRAEKQRLYEEGKIKKKDLVETELVKDGDNAYYQNLPDSWEIVPLKNIVNYRIGKTPNTKNKNYWTNHEGFPWISIADMGKDKYIGRTTRKITNKAVEEVFKGIVSPKGTLIMSFKLSIGKTNLLGKNSVHNEAIISIFPYWDNNNVLRNYLYLVLPIISNSGETISAIKGKTLNSKKIDVLPIPLPTIREQQEINTKVMLFLRILEIIS